MSDVELTKQAAAHRLILGSIRHFELDDADPVVVHVIASSALGILRELIGTRGTSYGEVTFASVLYEYALSRVEGRDPVAPMIDELRDDPTVAQIERAIRNAEIKSARDVKLAMPRDVERRLLSHIFKPYNFLKHADRDPTGTLELSSLEPVEAIAHAIAAYSFLFPGQPLDPEVDMFLGAYLKIKGRS